MVLAAERDPVRVLQIIREYMMPNHRLSDVTKIRSRIHGTVLAPEAPGRT